MQNHPQLEAAARYLLVTHSQTNKLTYVSTRNTLREEAIRHGFWKMHKAQARPVASNADAKQCKKHPWSKTHTTEECRNATPNSNRLTKASANTADTNTTSPGATIVKTEFTVSCHTFVIEANQSFTQDASWIIDSGANQHMCNDMKLLTNTEEVTRSHISTASGNSKLQSNITGKVKINDHFILDDVMYVPGLARNLISLSKIIESGFEVFTTPDGMTVLKNGGTLTAKVTNGLYLVKPDTIALTTVLDSHPCGYNATHKPTALWHHRIGHGSHQVLQRMKNHKLATGIETYNGKDVFCKSCSEGKQAHRPLGKISASRSTSAGLMIHTDIIGPMAELSIDGHHYVLTIVDDFSRLVTCVPIKKKSDAPSILIQYFSWSERQSQKKVQRLRTDGAGELGIKGYCTEHGIERQITIRGTSEMNGVAERANRTIMEKARSMLYSCPLKRCTWSYAVRYAVHIHNRLSTKANNRCISPYEAWSGRTPDLSHLKVFGTRGTSLLNDRSKLESKTEDVYFVGFHKERKGYMLLTVDGNEIYRRDVKLDEDGLVKWNLDPTTTRRYPKGIFSPHRMTRLLNHFIQQLIKKDHLPTSNLKRHQTNIPPSRNVT